VLAAVEGQLALLRHEWPDGTDLRVRMGIHTGQAVASDGRYTGLAVHRAARIGAAAHGGQVLVSQATQTLLEDEEEDLHVFLRDLGEQRLKDLDRPVRLYQVAGSNLPDAFAPIRSAEPALPVAAPAGRPVWRRPAVLAVAAAALVAAIAAVAFFATRSSGGGLGAIQPNHVGVIDPSSNEIVAEIPTGKRPGPVAASGGSVWVGNLDDRTLTRVDARQHAFAATVSLDNRTPTGIAAGATGVWVVHGLLGSVSHVDPQFGRVTRTLQLTPPNPLSAAGAVTLGAAAAWAVFGDGTFAQIDPVDVRVKAKTTTSGSPVALAEAQSSVWVVDALSAAVDRYSVEAFEQGPTRSINVGRRPTAIAWGEGALWIANTGDDTVTRVDPGTPGTQTIRVGREPVAIAAGGGAVWVANRGDRTVSRIDPDSREIVETIAVESAPAGVAFADGALFVTAQSR
jgi:YVTN family beta-propeller protein